MSSGHACTCIQCCNARTVPRRESAWSEEPRPGEYPQPDGRTEAPCDACGTTGTQSPRGMFGPRVACLNGKCCNARQAARKASLDAVHATITTGGAPTPKTEEETPEACKASESLTSCASDDASREATQVHHERTREWMERSMYGETKVADDDFPEHYERDQTALDDMLAAVRLDTIEECAQLCDTFLDRHKNAEGLKLWPVRECVTKIRALLSVGNAPESQEKKR